MGLLGTFVLGTMLSSVAPPNSATYCQTLLAGTLKRHGDLAAADLKATDAKGKPIQCHAGTSTRAGIATTLDNALGQSIGTIEIAFKHGRHDRSAGKSIARELARYIYTADSLADADPFVPGAHRSVLGQAIVERSIASDPDLVTLAMHVTLSGSTNEIIASNFGRIGKAADDDDRHVMADHAILKELTNGGSRLAVELPLHDRSGQTIGALSTSFTMLPGRSEEAVVAHAVDLRDIIARQIPSASALAQ